MSFIDDVKEWLIYIAVIVVAFVAVPAAIMLLANIHGAYVCSKYSSVTGKDTTWVFLDSCYIGTAEGWMRWEEYLQRGTASEGLKSIGDNLKKCESMYLAKGGVAPRLGAHFCGWRPAFRNGCTLPAERGAICVHKTKEIRWAWVAYAP